MKYDAKTMSPSAFRADILTLAQLVREAVDGEPESSRLEEVQGVFKHLTTSPSFSLAFLLVLFLTILLTVFAVLPPGAPAFLLCYPFGLALVACSIDAFLAWRGRRILSLMWMLVWVAILAIINSILVAVVVWPGQAA